MSAAEGRRVAEWAQTLGWPLIGDVLSQTGQPLPCADLWLGNAKAVTELSQAQIVVQIGASLTGKRLLQWQATCTPEEYWLVDPLEGRLDPAHHRGRRLVSNIESWLELHPAEKRRPGRWQSPNYLVRRGKSPKRTVRHSAKPVWRTVFVSICLNRASCLSVTAGGASD